MRIHTNCLQPGKAVKSDFVIGDMLVAYFKDFMPFSKTLMNDTIKKLADGEATFPDERNLAIFRYKGISFLTLINVLIIKLMF